MPPENKILDNKNKKHVSKKARPGAGRIISEKISSMSGKFEDVPAKGKVKTTAPEIRVLGKSGESHDGKKVDRGGTDETISFADESEQMPSKGFDAPGQHAYRPPEMDELFDLLRSLEKELSGAAKKRVYDNLQQLARSMGAGELGERGEAYHRVKTAFDRNQALVSKLSDLLGSGSPEIRGWAATFIEQLFPANDAAALLLDGLIDEKDGPAAVLMALSLARLNPGAPEVCDAIAKAYAQFQGDFNVDLRIARAWGHARCQAAAPVLAGHLSSGGYDQKMMALDGLRNLGKLDDPSIESMIADVMLTSEWEDINDQCADLFRQFVSHAPDVVDKLKAALAEGDPDRKHIIEKALKYMDPWQTPPLSQTRWPTADKYVPRFTSDAPWGEEVVDCIDVEDEAEAFAKIAAAKEIHPPLAIGVFGEWGAGKTFFMERIHAKVAELAGTGDDDAPLPFCRRIVQIRFNAWHYIESNLWASLVDYIFQELDLWLHRKEDKKDTINELFDTLSTTRQLKLESVRAVIEAHKENERAVQRRDNAREAYTQALEMNQPLGVGSIWNAVLNTFLETLSEEDHEKIKNAAAALGLPGLAQSAESLNAALTDAATQIGRAKFILGRSVAGLGRGRALVALVILLVLIPLSVAAVGAFLASNAGQAWGIGLNDFLFSVAGILTTVGSMLGVLSRKAAAALNKIQEFNKKLDNAIQDETSKQQRQLAEAQQTATDHRAELERAEKRLVDAAAREEAALQDWALATPRGRLKRFIREKVVGGDYAKHLGIITAIRKDFGQLAQLVADGNDGDDSRRLLQKAQEEYRAEVERIAAEVAASGDANPEIMQMMATLKKSVDAKPQPVTSFERIILYIDDLDRCPPKKVVSVLQAIHLLLCFRLFVVVVAVDARWISRALIRQYPELLEENVMWVETGVTADRRSAYDKMRVGATSHDYLEKIFQIPYWVRPMNPEDCSKYVAHITTKDRIREAEDREVDHDTSPEPREQETPIDTPPYPDSAGDAGEPNDGGQTPAPRGDAAPAQPSGEAGGKKTLYAEMFITDPEVTLLKQLAPFAGSSPRRGLRFINVYRLIKTSLKDHQLANLVGEQGQALAYRAIITQLAISTGAPTIAQTYFKIIIGENGKINSLTTLINRLKKESGTRPSQEWPLIFGALEKLKEVNQSMGIDNGSGMMAALREYAPITRRYSFTARPA